MVKHTGIYLIGWNPNVAHVSIPNADRTIDKLHLYKLSFSFAAPLADGSPHGITAHIVPAALITGYAVLVATTIVGLISAPICVVEDRAIHPLEGVFHSNVIAANK